MPNAVALSGTETGWCCVPYPRPSRHQAREQQPLQSPMLSKAGPEENNVCKILIVDDDPDFVESMRFILVSHGYEVVSAGDSDEGWAVLEAEEPDLVVLDVVMSSVLDGLTMSRRMHDDLARRDIPILMVTSIANIDYAALFPTDEALHIDAFLSKPVSAERLLSEVKRFIGRKKS